jgi:hypothetical protein
VLKAHSFLWHYLWLAPDVIQVGLAVFVYRRRLHQRFPIFFSYLIYEASETFTLYAMDMIPSVSAQAYWRALWVGLIVEGLIKFALLGELLRHLLRTKPPLAKIGRRLFICTGVGLALIAVAAAAYTTPDNPYWLVGGAHLLLQSLYIVQCGLILFVFLFAAYFKVAWDRVPFGIALGFAVVFCQHMASWAIVTGVPSPNKFVILTFLNMATYHVCVLIWFYYLLVPQKSATTSAVSLPETSLDIWNRELEHLLQR